MAEHRTKSPRRWIWRALWALGGLIGLVVIAVIVAVVMLKGAYGTTLARDFADGRQIGEYGRLEVGAVRGDLLDAFRIERLAIVDEDGVWLEARDIEIDWSPLELLGRSLTIERASVETIAIRRRPDTGDRAEAGAGQSGGRDLSAWRLVLGEARVGQLDLAQGVAGPAAQLTAQAGLTRDANGWRGQVSAERLDAPGDSLHADFTLTQRLDARFELAASPDGPLTALLGVAGTRLRADGQVSGDADTGEGRAQLLADERETVQIDARWGDQSLTIEGDADLGAWPGLEAAAERLAGAVTFQAQAPYGQTGLGSIDLEAGRLDLSSGALSLSARPAGGRALDVEARLQAGALALLSGDLLSAERLEIDGRLDLDGDQSFDARVSSTGFSAPGDIRAGTLQGDVSVSGPISEASARFDLQTGGFTLGVAQADAMLGAGPTLAGQAQWRGPAQRLELSDLRIETQAGVMSAEGGVDLAGQRWRINARSNALSLQALTDLVSGAGSVSVQAEGGFDGALSLDGAFDRFTPAGALDGRLAGPVSGEGGLERDADGALRLDGLDLTSPNLRLQASGAQSDTGWRVEGDAAWSGGAPISALRLDGALSARFEVETQGETLSVRTEARAPSLDIGPEQLSEPRLRLEASGPVSEISGRARLTGEGARGPLDLTADFSRMGEGARINALTGEAAGFQVDASGEAGPDSLQLTASLSPSAGFGRFQIEAALNEGRLNAEIDAEDLVFADLAYLDSARVTLDGPLEDAALSYALDGAYGAPFQAQGEGRVVLAGDAPALSVSLSGEYGTIAMATRSPLSLRLGSQLQAEADMTLGEGVLQASFAGGEAARLSLSLDNAPAALLSLRRASEPVEGRLSANADFARTDGIWTGEARVSGRDLHPAEAAPERNLDGEVRLTLTSQDARLTAEATGQALSARADVSVATGPVTGAGVLLRPEAPLSGVIRADGRVRDLAAFHLDPAQSLEGDIDLSAEISGVVSDPVIVGRGDLTDGRLRDGRAGLDLQALTASMAFTREGARLTSLSANDGRGGRLSGEGQLDTGDPIQAQTQIRFDRFRLLDRNDLEAIATGDVAFEFADGAGRISGSAVVDEADISPPGAGRKPITRIEVTEINRPAGLDAAPEQRAGPVIALDYQVRAPRRVFVRGPNYDTEWSFDLSITGDTTAPELAGQAQLVRGRAELLGRSFDLERGEVILDGDPGQARLSIAAVNERPDFTARVEVDGTVSAPQVTLSSRPDLPQDEIASRIIFGESASDLTALQAAQLGGALASLSGGGSAFDPLGALRQAAGLDLLGVRRNAAGQTVVSGGRYLTEDVFLQLEGASAGAAPSTRIDWTLTPRFTLTSSIDGRGRAGVALSWRVEYDDSPFQQIDLFRGFRDRLSGEPAQKSDAPAEREASTDAP